MNADARKQKYSDIQKYIMDNALMIPRYEERVFWVAQARVKGLHRHPATSRPGDPGSSWLHVSAGVGTSPYARIRVACRPEATLLTLTGIDSAGLPA